MPLSKPTFSRRSITILVTLLIIALCYAFYFLVYIENNEKDLNDKIYRRLERASLNISNTQGILKRNTKYIEYEIANIKNEDDYKDIIKEIDSIKEAFKDSTKKYKNFLVKNFPDKNWEDLNNLKLFDKDFEDLYKISNPNDTSKNHAKKLILKNDFEQKQKEFEQKK